MTRLRYQAMDRLADERGAAMVEFGLVVSVLMLIVVGILFFGRFLNYSIDETHLANEAARWAAVNVNPGSTSGRSCSSLQSCVQVQANSTELRAGSKDVTNTAGTAAQGAQVCVTFPSGTTNVGDPVQVQVKANFHFLSLLGVSPLTIPVSESATMRLEQAPTNYSAGCYP
jgi:Flp pilus assembly protein TadG